MNKKEVEDYWKIVNRSAAIVKTWPKWKRAWGMALINCRYCEKRYWGGRCVGVCYFCNKKGCDGNCP